MKLKKIVFRGSVSGIFGESVSSLGTEASPTVRSVHSLEMTPLGLVVTRLDGERRLVPVHDCGTADLEPEDPALLALPEREERPLPRPRKAKAAE